MNEASIFLWVLLAIGSYILGFLSSETRRASRHAAELDSLRCKVAKLRALCRLKAYREALELTDQQQEG